MSQNPNLQHRATLIGLLAVLCWSCTVGLMRAVAEPLGASAAQPASTPWPRCASPWRADGAGASWPLAQHASGLSLGLRPAVRGLRDLPVRGRGPGHDRSQAMEIGLINYLWPSLTIVLAVLCGQQAARWWLWPGVLICLWGLARVLGGESFSLPVMWSHVLGNPLAYGMGFAAALLWPAYSLLARRHGAGFNAVGLFVTWTAWRCGSNG
jgi:hypothetical protein